MIPSPGKLVSKPISLLAIRPMGPLASLVNNPPPLFFNLISPILELPLSPLLIRLPEILHLPSNSPLEGVL